jgi:hypothetical protein
MKKQNDSGFPVNAANFAILINSCIALGKKYNPAKFAIKLVNMAALLERVKEALRVVDTVEDEMSTARKFREHVFLELEGLVTRLVAAVGSSEIIEEKVKKFASLVKKFRGVRATPLPESSTPPSPEGVKNNSTAQKSYDRREDNFSQIVTFLKGEPNYLTNEPELKVEALQLMVNELAARNEAVRKTVANYNTARMARNELFFDKSSGLIPSAKAAKKYVRSVFKSGSAEFKSISGLAFTKNKKG